MGAANESRGLAMVQYVKTFRTGLAVIALITLASCAQPSAAPRPDATAPPSQSADQAPTPTATTAAPTANTDTPGPSGYFEGKVKDADGYTFDVAVNLQATDVEESIANDKPGFMSAEFKFTLALQLTNTTPGRNITFQPVSGVTKPFGNPKFIVSAAWNAGSPMCAAMKVATNACATVMGYGYADSALLPGITVQLEPFMGRPAGDKTAGLAGFAEADWPVIKEALSKPDALILGYEGGDYTRFGCKGSGLLGWVVAASAPAYECGATFADVVQQPVATR
jgi:hypothetical protein